MKVLFLVPEQYGLFDPLKEAFLYLGIEVYPFSYQNFIKKWMLRVNDQIFRLPDKFRLKWEGYFLEKINQEYIEIYDQIDPDLIFVYNNEITAISQQHLYSENKWLANKSNDEIEEIVNKILNYFNENIF